VVVAALDPGDQGPPVLGHLPDAQARLVRRMSGAADRRPARTPSGARARRPQSGSAS
jgi:hypothetical protein